MRQDRRKEPTVRLIIDFPMEQHAYLKTLAEKRGMSMCQYVIESLCENMEKKEHIDLSENIFKKILSKVIEENDDVLKRLADK